MHQLRVSVAWSIRFCLHFIFFSFGVFLLLPLYFEIVTCIGWLLYLNTSATAYFELSSLTGMRNIEVSSSPCMLYNPKIVEPDHFVLHFFKMLTLLVKIKEAEYISPRNNMIHCLGATKVILTS